MVYHYKLRLHKFWAFLTKDRQGEKMYVKLTKHATNLTKVVFKFSTKIHDCKTFSTNVSYGLPLLKHKKNLESAS